MEGPRLAERLLNQSRTDSALLAELSHAWRGTGDVRDALWWHAHPGTPTPDGLPDPASALAPLKAAVYSRTAAAEPVIELTDPATGTTTRSTARERELGEALRLQAANAHALAELLDRFGAGRAHPLPSVTERQEAAVEPADAAATVGAGPSPARPLPSRTRRDVLLVAAGVAAGVLVALGVQALGIRPSIPAAGPTPAVTPSPAPSRQMLDAVIGNARDLGMDLASGWVIVPPDAADSDPFWMFDEAFGVRAAGDAADLGEDIVASTIRTIASTAGYAVYVAQNRADEYCLILSDPAHRGWTRACNNADGIRAAGLGITGDVPGSTTGSTTQVDLIWGADGSFRLEPSAALDQ